jgi:O-methyltransferase
MAPETPKQWHRHYIRKTAEYVKKNEIEGCFVECGVKQGSSSVIMSQVLDRDGYLFDTWHGFPHFSDVDASSDSKKKKLKKRVKTGKNTFTECTDNLIKNNVMDKCKMIKGDICITVPNFVDAYRDDLKISMLHIDTDLYEPANIALDQFWEFMSFGGAVFFHDYGDKKWPGIKKVVKNHIEQYENDYSCWVFNSFELCSCVLFKDNTAKSLKGFTNLL